MALTATRKLAIRNMLKDIATQMYNISDAYSMIDLFFGRYNDELEDLEDDQYRAMFNDFCDFYGDELVA